MSNVTVGQVGMRVVAMRYSNCPLLEFLLFVNRGLYGVEPGGVCSALFCSQFVLECTIRKLFEKKNKKTFTMADLTAVHFG